MEGVGIISDLDERIISHISRGNSVAYENIVLYHLDDIRKIRTYMLDILRDSYFYDARMLNQCFHMAISEHKINVNDLLLTGTKIVAENKDVIKIAM